MVYKLWHEFSVGVASCLYGNFQAAGCKVLLIVFVYRVVACDAGIDS